MRTLFFGTSDFAVPSLRVVAQTSQLVAVVTQPDRPAGRGHRMQATPVKRFALERGLAVHEPTDLRAFVRDLAEQARFDLFVLASYGRMLPQALLDLPRVGSLNVHPSLLPAYRGATPIQSVLRNGERRTGVSVMLMDAGMDTGDIVAQAPVDIADDECYGALHDRLAEVGARLLGEALEHAATGELTAHPQRGESSITAPLSRADLQVDWAWPCARIVNAIRAFSPQPAARARLAGEPVKLLRAHVAPASQRPGSPGDLLGVEGDALLVAAGQGVVALEELIPANRSGLSGRAFAQRAEVVR
ncbi:MAG: methionyl-tRNA formyltransferase [Vulcanimicrobiaceae bacterium]